MRAAQIHTQLMHATLRSIALAVSAACLPASAALSGVTPSGFLVTHRIETRAEPAVVFAALAQPGKWWNAEHTYSGNAENLRMRMAAGGCFCEAWERNSVEHGRVILALAGKRLRLEGALGPLQDMAVNAILDFRIEPHGGGSAVTMTYRVRGAADAALDKVASPVDKVMGDQLQRLGKYADASVADARPLALEEHSYEAGGARLRYVAAGDHGDPVILLHDADSTIDKQWVATGVLRAVSAQFRVIAAEARSPDDVLRLMDHLKLAKAHVAGYGAGAQIAAKVAIAHPDRVQTLTLAGGTSLPADDAAMVALPVPTLGIVGTLDPALRDFLALKPRMPRFVRMVSIEGATHENATASSDFGVALAYFMRYNPIAP